MSDSDIVRIYRMPGGTKGHYDALVEASDDVMAAGAKVHLAGSNDSDLWVVEVWSSPEELAAWKESQAAGNEDVLASVPDAEVIEFDLHQLLATS